MVFNKSGRILNCSRGFTFINNTENATVSSYSYLGDTFTLFGSFNHATNEIRTIFTLFDSVIKPIAMYACPIWVPQVAGDLLCTKWMNEEVNELHITSALSKIQ